MTHEPTEEQIRQKIVEDVAEALGLSPEAVDTDAEMATLGIDSIRAFSMTGDLAEWLDCELSATLLWEFPTIRLLAGELARIKASSSSNSPSQ